MCNTRVDAPEEDDLGWVNGCEHLLGWAVDISGAEEEEAPDDVERVASFLVDLGLWDEEEGSELDVEQLRTAALKMADPPTWLPEGVENPTTISLFDCYPVWPPAVSVSCSEYDSGPFGASCKMWFRCATKPQSEPT